MAAEAHVSGQSSKQDGGSRRAGGVGLLPVLLGAVVVLGLGAGFAIGSATQGKSGGQRSSSTLAPAIAVSSVRIASVPVTDASVTLPTLRSRPSAAKTHAAPSGQSAAASATSSASEGAPASAPTTTSASSAPASSPSVSSPAPPPAKSAPAQSSPPSSKSEPVHSGSGGGA
jgi:hypothetical protein